MSNILTSTRRAFSVTIEISIMKKYISIYLRETYLTSSKV